MAQNSSLSEAHFFIIEELLKRSDVGSIFTSYEMRELLTNKGILSNCKELDKKSKIATCENSARKRIQNILKTLQNVLKIDIIKKGKANSVTAGYLIESTITFELRMFISLYKSVYFNNELLKVLVSENNVYSNLCLDYQHNLNSDIKRINTILYAIRDSQILEIKYQGNRDKKQSTIKIKPYLLKTYLNRYYVISDGDEEFEYRSYCISNIHSIIPVKDEKFDMPDIKEIKKQFSEIIGVSMYRVRPETVVLKFKAKQHLYFIDEKWVKDYKIIEGNINDREVTISFEARHNGELEQRIINFNENITVISPESLKNKVINKLKRTLSNYNV